MNIPISFIKYYKPSVINNKNLNNIILKKISERKDFFIEDIKLILTRTSYDNFELNDILHYNKNKMKKLTTKLLYDIILNIFSDSNYVKILKKEKTEKSQIWINVIFKFYQLLFSILNEIEKESNL